MFKLWTFIEQCDKLVALDGELYVANQITAFVIECKKINPKLIDNQCNCSFDFAQII